MISADGVFPNGTRVASIIELIRAHDEAASVDAIAAHFALTASQVDQALRFHSHNFELVEAQIPRC